MRRLRSPQSQTSFVFRPVFLLRRVLGIQTRLGNFRTPPDHLLSENCCADRQPTTHCRDSAYRQLHFWERNHSLQGAAVLGEDGFWRLGVRIFLKPLATIWFAFFVAEQNGHPVVKIGDRTYNPDLAKPDTCNEIYEGIIDRVKDAFSFPKKSKGKTIGFTVEPQP